MLDTLSEKFYTPKKLYMEIKVCSCIGKDVIENGSPLIIGVSINNSYFKEGNLEKLLLWATKLTQSVFIMIPDEPAVYTLLALGYAKPKAEREARLKANSLQNKIMQIANRLELVGIRIIRWKDVVGTVAYLESLVEIKHAYDTDQCFRQAVRDTTQEVLSKNLSHVPNETEIDLGTIFLLQELAFICRSDVILKSTKIAYVYHKTMEVMKDIMVGRYLFKSSSVGYITVE